MTKLTPAPPSLNGSTARCHSGPCSQSNGVLACSSSQPSNASRGRADATISMSDEQSDATQRRRPNGNGDCSMRRDNRPRSRWPRNWRRPSMSIGRLYTHKHCSTVADPVARPTSKIVIEHIEHVAHFRTVCLSSGFRFNRSETVCRSECAAPAGYAWPACPSALRNRTS